MVDRITIKKPDDWHCHVRDGEMLKANIGYTAAHFRRFHRSTNSLLKNRTSFPFRFSFVYLGIRLCSR